MWRLRFWGILALPYWEFINRVWRLIFPTMPCLWVCKSAVTRLYLSVLFVEMPRCTLLILFLRTLKLATGSAFSVKKEEKINVGVRHRFSIWIFLYGCWKKTENVLSSRSHQNGEQDYRNVEVPRGTWQLFRFLNCFKHVDPFWTLNVCRVRFYGFLLNFKRLLAMVETHELKY